MPISIFNVKLNELDEIGNVLLEAVLEKVSNNNYVRVDFKEDNEQGFFTERNEPHAIFTSLLEIEEIKDIFSGNGVDECIKSVYRLTGDCTLFENIKENIQYRRVYNIARDKFNLLEPMEIAVKSSSDDEIILCANWSNENGKEYVDVAYIQC